MKKRTKKLLSVQVALGGQLRKIGRRLFLFLRNEIYLSRSLIGTILQNIENTDFLKFSVKFVCRHPPVTADVRQWRDGRPPHSCGKQKQREFDMLRYKLAIAAALVPVVGLLAVPAHAQLTGSCAIKKTEIASANASDQSNSMNWVNVGTAGSITFTEAKSGCVAGTFSASAGNASQGDNVRLQVLLDGNACEPLTGNFNFASYDDSGFPANSAEFFCGAAVAAGLHTVQVQYHSGSGGNAEVHQRTLEVRHN